MTIEEFIEKCQKRPLPSSPMARAKMLARELAEGAYYKVWNEHIEIHAEPSTDAAGVRENILVPHHNFLISYLTKRWNNEYPKFKWLIIHNFIDENFYLTDKALNLLEETNLATVFISYKRSESSAFALLIHDRLRAAGLEPFLDMQLEVGQLWEDELQKKIKSVDYFMLLLGKETLKSAITIKEILWANDAGKKILIIRHNNFSFKDIDWTIIPDDKKQTRARVKSIIEDTHSIAVLEENPSEYNSTLDRIVNFFQFAETKTE